MHYLLNVLSVVSDVILTVILIHNVKAFYSNGKYFPDSKAITEVPDDIPDGATEIDLSGCQISRLRDLSFMNLSNCTYLSLSTNSISQIDVGAFNGLKNLKKLILSGNKLASLDPGVFSALISLKELDLSNNKISTIKSGVLGGLPRPLTLKLHDNPVQCASDICWLKVEYYKDTINLSKLPTCANGKDWILWGNCLEEGK